MAHQRSGVRRPIIPHWSFNAGILLAHSIKDGGGVWASCGYCKLWKPVDLSATVLKRNPLFTFWNTYGKCPQCGNAVSFHGTHAPGARVWPFITDDPRQTDALKAAWEAERRRMIGMAD